MTQSSALIAALAVLLLPLATGCRGDDESPGASGPHSAAEEVSEPDGQPTPSRVSAAEEILEAHVGPSAKVPEVRSGAGPLIDLVVETGLARNDRLGAKEICSTLKDEVPKVDSVNVIARGGPGNRQIFSAVCLGPPLP